VGGARGRGGKTVSVPPPAHHDLMHMAFSVGGPTAWAEPRSGKEEGFCLIFSHSWAGGGICPMGHNPIPHGPSPALFFSCSGNREHLRAQATAGIVQTIISIIWVSLHFVTLLKSLW